MASANSFEDIPAFPNDVPTAQVSTLSLSGLRAGDSLVAESLLSSAQKLGFFLLNLREDALGRHVIKEMDNLFDLAKIGLNLPNDIKEKYKNNAPRSFLRQVQFTK